MPQVPHKKSQGSQAAASEDDNCSACGLPLRGAQFCTHCGPPELPPEDVANHLSTGKMIASIILIVLSFTAVAMTKLGIEIGMFATQPRVETIIPTENRAQGKDFTVTHVVNVVMANVRQYPSPDGIIIMVLKQGAAVEILETKGRWSHIAAHDKIGWIFSELVTAQVE